MVVLELRTGLFPDRETVRAALAALLARQGTVMRSIDLAAQQAPGDWDAVVAAIRAADRVVTV